jgi:hypothetical protein
MSCRLNILSLGVQGRGLNTAPLLVLNLEGVVSSRKLAKKVIHRP